MPAVCGAKLRPPTISCAVPRDAQAEKPFYLFQRSTNVFSWQAFIGLQWPASKTERGQPDSAAKIGAAGPSVWETWREANEVFRHDADNRPLPPLAWNAASPLPVACTGADRVLVRTSNPRASWWANVVQKYSTPQETKQGGIAGRINSCFLNSLNGKALCTPNAQGHCPDNASMTALIAYMSWLAQPDNNPENIPSPMPRAFPLVAAGKGIKTHGAKIFLQKCAFCHGADGEGRYEDDTYFRPALWGSNSFNTSAGMDSTADLTPFVFGNMPFHSGGELSPQEARDLACFIDGKPRPKGPTQKNPSDKSDITCSDF